MPDLDQLTDTVIHELARRPGERQRHREILRIQEVIREAAPGVVPLLLDLEALTNAREALAIEVALVVGLRAGRADRQAADLDEATMELVRDLAMTGLNLPKRKRLQAMVEVLALDLSTDADVFGR